MKQYETVAKAVRLEYDKTNADVFIVFKICDEKFKQEMIKDFSQEMSLIIKKD